MANEIIAERSLLARLETQPRVRDYLAQAVAMGRVSHAYLFLGAPGSGKLDAAWALAQQLICEDGGCGSCDACVRVARQTHPDVHYFAPESAVGYLIDQVRALLAEVSLSPIRSRRKVYIIDRAEQLRANTANALLKTLEEPPANVVFILLGPCSARLSCDRSGGAAARARCGRIARHRRGIRIRLADGGFVPGALTVR